MKNKIVIETRILFVITIMVSLLTIISVWLYGETQGRTIIDNSLISTSILFMSFFSFLSVGLYKGIYITNDLKIVARKINTIKIPKLSENVVNDNFDSGDGIAGFIIGILVWLAVTFLLWAFLIIFDAVIWAIITAIFASIYWIFYRALFFVFRNSPQCKEKVFESLKFAFGYSVLYISWIYVLLFIVQFYIN